MTTTDITLKKEGFGLLLLSVLSQQVVFTVCLFCHPLLLYVSLWVVRVPVVIIWSMAFGLPLVYVRPLSAKTYFRSITTVGWLFVFASVVWIMAYWYFSGQEGVPVSWDAVKLHYKP